MNATVPGTVLTTLINNKMLPDPFYGMNNGEEKNITMEYTPSQNEQLLVRLRGWNVAEQNIEIK